MKFLFICGCIEEGKDGVGDYTKKLALELIRQGNQCSIIALMDKFIENEEKWSNTESTLNELRLPFKNGIKQNGIKAYNWIKEMNFDWISLQYVPFSFDNRGLHFGLSDLIVKLRIQCKLQIMIHEMWVGRDEGDSLKQKCLSYFQENIINRLLKITSPDLIHTHLPLFSSNINKMGFQCYELPLFSNIEFIKKTSYENVNRIFRMTFFSQIELNQTITNFINNFCSELSVRGLRCEIFLIGGNSDKMKMAVNFFKSFCPEVDKVIYTGFLNEESLSIMLQSTDLGITPMPIHALGKSGSVAAFLSHGIPVAIPRSFHKYEKRETNLKKSFFIEELCKSLISKPNWNEYISAKSNAALAKNKISTFAVTKIFLKDLSTYKVR